MKEILICTFFPFSMSFRHEGKILQGQMKKTGFTGKSEDNLIRKLKSLSAVEAQVLSVTCRMLKG